MMLLLIFSGETLKDFTDSLGKETKHAKVGFDQQVVPNEFMEQHI